MRSIRVLVSIAFASATLMLGAGTALASCNPGRAAVAFAGFAGTQGSLSGVKGVQANIEEYHPFVSSGSESLLWVMLNSGTTKWSQVGFWQTPASHQIFEQHTDATGHVFTNMWSGSTSSTTNYKVLATQTSDTNQTWQFYVAGTLRSTVSRSWDPTGYQVYGETHSEADQMSGGSSSLTAKALIDNPLKQHSTGTWSNVSTAAGVNNASWYGASMGPTTADYYIWDKACAS